MTFSGFDDMTISRIFPLSHQKLNGICAPMTITADRLKIEIPINKKTGLDINLKIDKIMRNVQQACISNLLVTVFAARHLDKSQMIDNFKTPDNFIYGSQPAKN